MKDLKRWIKNWKRFLLAILAVIIVIGFLFQSKGVNMNDLTSILKNKAVLSGVFLLLSTIGFSSIFVLFDNPISKNNEELIVLLPLKASSWESQLRALTIYDYGQEIRNQINILKTLKADKNLIDNLEKDRIMNIRNAIITLTGSAQATKILTKEETDKIIDDTNKVIDYNELVKGYIKGNTVVIEGVNLLNLKINEKKTILSKLHYNKSIYWIICIFFQMIGLFIGIVSVSSK